jgi:hypothetical protein
MMPMQSGPLTEQPAVCEVFSVPRVAVVAEGMGLGAGWSLDLLTANSRGERWDFDDPAERDEARRLAKRSKPRRIIGSPDCTVFSILQNLTPGRVGSPEHAKAFAKATRHVEFCCRGDYYFREHPASATSWKLGCVREMMAAKGTR